MMEAKAISTERYDWIDFGKGFLMFLVFIFHSEIIFSDHHSWSFMFSPIRMSGFFFLSGYLFTRDLGNVPFRKKYMQVLRSVVIPYFIYMAIYFVPKLLIFDAISVKQMIIDILVFRASWFIPVMGIMQLLYGYTLSKRGNIRTVYFVLAGSCIASIFFVSLYRINPAWVQETPFWTSDIASGKMPFCLNNASLASLFFGAGIIVRNYFNLNNLRVKTHILAILLCLYIVVMLVDKNWLGSSMEIHLCKITNEPLPFIYAAFGIFILCCVSLKINKIAPINFIGKNSLNFYYLNALMLRVSVVIITKIHIIDYVRNWGYAGVIFNAFTAITLSYITVLFIISFFPILTGRKDVYNNISKKLGLKINW